MAVSMVFIGNIKLFIKTHITVRELCFASSSPDSISTPLRPPEDDGDLVSPFEPNQTLTSLFLLYFQEETVLGERRRKRKKEKGKMEERNEE